MKKGLKLILSFLMALALMIPLQSQNVDAAKTQTNFKRVINVVYDDSGSMFRNSAGNSVGDNDRWCNAKYSLEVFASMLSETDTMNVYFMSNYDKGAALQLSGKDGAKKNVDKVHSYYTDEGPTPFGAVTTALSDLEKVDADEKWLVILTDGQFNSVSNSDVAKTLKKKPDGISVMLLAMGDEAASVADSLSGLEKNKQIYTAKAQSSSEILEQITDISTQVFNSNKLDNKDSNKISFDVPMSELTVFAQGKNVTIESITDSSGKTYKPSSVVDVQYCESAEKSNNNGPYKVATNLVGKVATFDQSLPAGDYTIKVSGADYGIKVFYKPNIDIAAYIYKSKNHSKGDEVTDAGNLKAGDYIIEFGFIDADTGEAIGDSKLLGNVTYNATVTQDGKVIKDSVKSGEEITLDEGELVIDVTGTFLEINSVTTTINEGIVSDKDAEYTISNNPTYNIYKNKVTTGDSAKSNDLDPIKVEMKFNGNELTEEEWANLETPTASLEGKGGWFAKLFRLNNTVDNVRIEKSDTIGVFNVYPEIDKTKWGRYSDATLNLKLNQKDEATGVVWKGNSTVTMHVKDCRNLFVQFAPLIISLAFLIVILILIIGYLVKKRFSKRLKAPIIDSRPKKIGGKSREDKGRFTKSKTLVPYKAEEAVITITPPGVSAPKIRVRACGGTKMFVFNAASHAKNPKLLFDGDQIDPKRPYINGNTIISFEDQDYTYECHW